MFRKFIREIDKRPLIPFSYSGIIGLYAALYVWGAN